MTLDDYLIRFGYELMRQPDSFALAGKLDSGFNSLLQTFILQLQCSLEAVQ